MNVFQYTAINNTHGTENLIKSYGVVPQDAILSKQLAGVISRDKANGLAKLRGIHPDLGLFQDELDTLKAKIKSDLDAEKKDFLNADGQSLKNDVAELKRGVNSPKEEGRSKQELMIIGGVIVIGLAIIFKK